MIMRMFERNEYFNRFKSHTRPIKFPDINVICQRYIMFDCGFRSFGGAVVNLSASFTVIIKGKGDVKCSLTVSLTPSLP